MEQSQAARKALRKEKIAARDALAPEVREALSLDIVKKIAASQVYRQARTVLLYRATRGEVRLEALETDPASQGKRLAFPLCVSDTEMIALLPQGANAWQAGYYGIMEPVRERSTPIDPADIDLVICPCTVFDDQCHRMGMGAGFYDRYLAQCTNAHIVSVAFEVQKAEAVPAEPWDKPMEMTFTEACVYVRP